MLRGCHDACMADKDVLGRAGEDRAARHLQSCGYTVLDRNWRIRDGELDLVVARRGELVVVEVKTRTRPGLRAPVRGDRRAASSRACGALAFAWIAAHPEQAQGRRLRVDAIAIIGPDPATGALEHLEDRAVTTARTWAIALSGLDGALVEVEADLSNQTAAVPHHRAPRQSARRSGAARAQRERELRTLASAPPADGESVAGESAQARARPSTSRSRSPRSRPKDRWMPPRSHRPSTSANSDSTGGCGPCQGCCRRSWLPRERASAA